MASPFNIAFGEAPTNPIARTREFHEILDTFTDETPESRIYIISGPRGCGKTALLASLSDEFRKEGYLVVDLNPLKEMEEQFASKLYETGRMWKLFLSPEFSFSFKGLTFSLKGNVPVSNVETLIERMLSYLKRKEKRVLITIDDVSPTSDMKSFAFFYQQLLRGGLQVFLLMSGLYENVSDLERGKSLTFLLRAPKVILRPLDRISIAYAYKEILGIDIETAAKYAKLTKGYAYGYQALGSLLYKNTNPSVIMDRFDSLLSENSYSLIWEKLTEKEKDILKAMTKSTAQESICKEASLSNGNLQNYKQKLVKMGLVDDTKRGIMEFALPRFGEFVRLQIIFEKD